MFNVYFEAVEHTFKHVFKVHCVFRKGSTYIKKCATCAMKVYIV